MSDYSKTAVGNDPLDLVHDGNRVCLDIAEGAGHAAREIEYNHYIRFRRSDLGRKMEALVLTQSFTRIKGCRYLLGIECQTWVPA